MLLFVDDADHCLAGREATLRERLLTHFGAGRLDRLLAAGVSPEGNALLALRAQQLVRPELRQALGWTVRNIVKDSWEPLPPRPALTAANHQNAVRHSAEALQELGDCLLAPAPVSARGMALALLLITDWTGPLFHPCPDERLAVAIHDAVSALDPWKA